MNTAAEILEALHDMADAEHARTLMRFFQTGPGEYAEGDIFIGLRNPQVRMVVKEAWRDTPLAQAVALVKSPEHEVRLCGVLIMVEQYQRTHDAAVRSVIYHTYLDLHPYINNWDLVDL